MSFAAISLKRKHHPRSGIKGHVSKSIKRQRKKLEALSVGRHFPRNLQKQDRIVICSPVLILKKNNLCSIKMMNRFGIVKQGITNQVPCSFIVGYSVMSCKRNQKPFRTAYPSLLTLCRVQKSMCILTMLQIVKNYPFLARCFFQHGSLRRHHINWLKIIK